MEKTIKKQTKSGLSYLAFENPDKLTSADIGKTVLIAGQPDMLILYKVHPEGTPGFKDGGVECVIGVSGIAKYCYFLDQVKLYDGRDLNQKPKGNRGRPKKVKDESIVSLVEKPKGKRGRPRKVKVD